MSIFFCAILSLVLFNGVFLIKATPHLSIKRRSIHNRKLRPKSVVDSVEGLSADDIPSLLPSLPRNGEEEDSVTELPNTTQHLQHLVKGIFLNKGQSVFDL